MWSVSFLAVTGFPLKLINLLVVSSQTATFEGPKKGFGGSGVSWLGCAGMCQFLQLGLDWCVPYPLQEPGVQTPKPPIHEG